MIFAIEHDNKLKCKTFWGGHGCDLTNGHIPSAIHVCYNEEDERHYSIVNEILHPAYEGWIEDGWNNPTRGRWGITDAGYVVGLFS